MSRANTEVFRNMDGSESCRSYRVIIAKKQDGNVYLDQRYFQYSATTVKHLRAFLGHGIADTRAKAKSGEYILTNLN
jgi:hypothetical protein